MHFFSMKFLIQMMLQRLPNFFFAFFQRVTDVLSIDAQEGTVEGEEGGDKEDAELILVEYSSDSEDIADKERSVLQQFVLH